MGRTETRDFSRAMPLSTTLWSVNVCLGKIIQLVSQVFLSCFSKGTEPVEVEVFQSSFGQKQSKSFVDQKFSQVSSSYSLLPCQQSRWRNTSDHVKPEVFIIRSSMQKDSHCRQYKLPPTIDVAERK